MNKKIVSGFIVGVLFLGLLILPGRGLAQTSDVTVSALQAQIQALLDKIKVLQGQLATAQGSGEQWCYTFNTNLKIGDQNDDVTNLDRALVKEGLLSQDVFQDGRTALNFDEMTASAVSGFQEKYRSEILTPNGLKSGTGYVGASTRKKLNQLYECGDNVVQPKPDSAIVVVSPQSGQVVSSPLKISGYASKGKWGVFEGEAGNASLFDSSGRKLGVAILKVTNFSYEPSVTQFNFEGSINFSVPQTETGYLIFTGNDPSGFREAGEFRVEVRFSQVPSQTGMKIISPVARQNVELGKPIEIKLNKPMFSDSHILAYKTVLVDIYGNSTNGSVGLFGAGATSMIWDGVVLEAGCTSSCGQVTIKPGMYKIQLIKFGEPNKVVAESDYFNIIASASNTTGITVVSPNGGEKWMLNSGNVFIKWTPDPESNFVEAYLEKKQGDQFVTVGKVIKAGKGSIQWFGEIDRDSNYAPAGDGYYIRLVNTQTGATDRSDNPFTLLPADYMKVDFRIDGSDSSVSIPAGGKSVKLTWTSVNADSCNFLPNDLGDAINGLPPSGERTVFLKENKNNWDYAVSMVCSLSAGSRSDYVNVLRNTSSQGITITSPNGGENWSAGSVWSVKWTGNNSGKNIAINLIDYTPGARYGTQYVIRDGSAVWRSNPQDSSNATYGDYFAWNIPLSIPAGSYYKVYVGDATPNSPTTGSSDGSDNYFAIDSAGTAVNHPPFFASFPASLSQAVGQTSRLRWDAGDYDFADYAGTTFTSMLDPYVDGAIYQQPVDCGTKPAGQNSLCMDVKWLKAGTYTLKVTVKDNKGATAENRLTVIVADQISVSQNTAFWPGSFLAGINNIKIGSYIVKAPSSEGIRINTITVGAGQNASSFQNIRVMVGGQQFGITQPVLVNNGTYAFTGTLVIPAGGMAIVDAYADVLPSGQPGTTNATNFSNCGAVGQSSYEAYNCNSVAGQTMTITTVSSAACGDINADGLINASDSVMYQNYIFSGGTVPTGVKTDFNGDGQPDVFDLIILNDYLYSHGPAPTCTVPGGGTPAGAN